MSEAEPQDDFDLGEMLITTAALLELLGDRLNVERDLVKLLFAFAATNGWNVAEALATIRNDLAVRETGTARDERRRQEYVARLTELLAAVGKTPG